MATPLEILKQQVLLKPKAGKELDPYFQAAGLENTGYNVGLIAQGKTPLTSDLASKTYDKYFGGTGNKEAVLGYELSRGSSLEDFESQLQSDYKSKAKQDYSGQSYDLGKAQMMYNAQTGEQLNTPQNNLSVAGMAGSSQVTVPNATGANTGSQVASTPQYQILNTTEMAKYKPDQYERLASGAVVLKAGVTPIAGTTKTINTPTASAVNIPAGATYISDPKQLAGLKETDIFRTPDGKIYKLPTQPVVDNGLATTGDIVTGGISVTGGGTNNAVPVAETTYASMLSQIANLKTQIETENKARETETTSKITTLQKELDTARANQDTAIQDTKQKALDALEEGNAIFRKAQQEKIALGNRLEGLLTEGQALLNQQKNATGLGAIRNPRIAQTQSDITAQAGVIEAALAAKQGDMNSAYGVLDATINAVNLYKTDELNYYKNIADNAESGLVTLKKDQKDYLDYKLTSLKDEMKTAQDNADKLKEIFQDPDKAVQFAKAGITINTPQEQWGALLAKQAYTEELADTSNKMALDGASYLPDGQTAPAGSQIVTNTDSKGVTKRWYIPAKAVTGGGGGSVGGGTDYGTVTNPSTTTQLVDKNGKPIKLTATQVDAISSFDNTLKQIEESKPLLDVVNTGPIVGRASGLLRLVGLDDPNRISLDAKLSSIKSNFMKAISGAAVSESEVARLSKFLPSINDDEQVLKIKLAELESFISTQKQTFINTLGAVQNTQPVVDNNVDNLRLKYNY